MTVLNKRRRSIIWKIPTEQFKQAVAGSRSVNQLVETFFKHSGNQRTIRKRLEEEQHDISHFSGKSWAKGAKGISSHPKYTISEILIENSKYTNNQQLKKRLLLELNWPNKCDICYQLPVWRDSPLVLQLDHINGKHTDNRIENLRLLCPNCHSQTSTWCGKTKARPKLPTENTTTERDIVRVPINTCLDCSKRIEKRAKRCIECHKASKQKLPAKNKCIDCGIVIKSESSRCAKCHPISTRKVPNRPSLEQLIQDLETMTKVTMGQKYGVSDKTIAKWIKTYQAQNNKTPDLIFQD